MDDFTLNWIYELTNICPESAIIVSDDLLHDTLVSVESLFKAMSFECYSPISDLINDFITPIDGASPLIDNHPRNRNYKANYNEKHHEQKQNLENDPFTYDNGLYILTIIVLLLVITILLNIQRKCVILVFIFSMQSSITYTQSINELNCSETVTGYLSSETEVSYTFYITPQTDVELNGCASDFDTVFTVYSLFGEVAYADEGCAGNGNHASYIYLSYDTCSDSSYDGPYYLNITGYDNSSFGNYQIDYLCYTELNITHAPTTTYPLITCGETVSGYLSFGTQVSFSFTPQNDVELDGCASDFDTVFAIYRESDDVQVFHNDDGCDGDDNYASYIFLPSCSIYNGAYYLNISGYNHTSFGDYSVDYICHMDPTLPPTNPSNSPTINPTPAPIYNLSCGETVSGYLPAKTEVTYSFTPQTDVELNGCASDFDTVFTIYLESEVVAEKDDGCDKNNPSWIGAYIYLSYTACTNCTYYFNIKGFLDGSPAGSSFGNYEVDYVCQPTKAPLSAGMTHEPTTNPTNNPTAAPIYDLTCGETISGYLSAGREVTYSFIAWWDVEFNGCASDFDTVFTIYWTENNDVMASNNDGCDSNTASYIYLKETCLFNCHYHLTINGSNDTSFGNYQFDYVCHFPTNNPTRNPSIPPTNNPTSLPTTSLPPTKNPTAPTNTPSPPPTKNPTISADITFQRSAIRLPQRLEHPITVYYSTSLITISTNTSNDIYILSPFTGNDVENKNYSSNFGSMQTQQPDFWPYPIHCFIGSLRLSAEMYWSGFTSCYATRNQYLYIIQPGDTYGHFSFMLLIYNMEDNSFINQSSYQYNYSFVGGGDYLICTYFQSETLMVMHGVTSPLSSELGDDWYWDSQAYGIWYSVESNEWNITRWFDFSEVRPGTACAYYNDYVYIFGGISMSELFGNTILSYGEKCIGFPDGTTLPDCEFFYEAMEYPRRDFYISVILERYLLIYGGTTDEAMNNMEVFDMRSETFVTSIPNTLGSLNVQDFSSLVSSEVLMIIGGRYRESNGPLESIEYMDLAELFIDKTKIEYLLPCLTTYIDNVPNYVRIDNYLFEAQTQLQFEVIDTNGTGFTLDLDTLYNEGTSLKCSRASNANLQCYFYYSVDLTHSDVYMFDVINLNTISANTGIDMMNNHYVMWMKWLPRIYFGFGEVVGLNNMDSEEFSLFADNWDIIGFGRGGVHSVQDSIFTFRSDSCKLSLDIATEQQLTIGEHVYLISDWSLSTATSLDLPIYISSNDIKDFDHIMTITDYGIEKSICTLCRIENDNEVINGSCNECKEGIKVTDLETYDINNNSYEISITSEFDGMDPQQTTIIAHRIVMDVQIDVFVSINDSIGIYPTAELLVVPSYNKTNPSQPNGTFTITFDEAFSFDGDGTLLIDFYEDICTLTYDNNNINCYDDSIIIPWTMTFKDKDVDTNIYNIELGSLDTYIIGQNSFEFWREIQEISIDLINAISLGENIDVNITVLDKSIVQTTSSIIISNTEHNIYSLIEITYNILNDTIKSCFVNSPNMDIITACDEGIPFKTSTADIVNGSITLNISSPDTYIEPQQHLLFIAECEVGSYTFGSNDTSYVCVPCEIGSVGLLANSKCFDCDVESIDGVECAGSSDLTISYNYWVKISDSGSIFSNFCPAGFCCIHFDGCNYEELKYSDFGICAYGRDPSVPLCGKCKEGYSEVFGSSQCKKCTKSNYSLLLLPMILAMIFVLIILIIDPPPKPVEEEVNYAKQLLIDDVKAIQLCTLRPLLYFAQALNFITIQNGLFFYFSPLTRILSLDIFDASSGNDRGSGICLTNGMDSMTKQMWYLLFPFCIFISTAIYALINLCLKWKYKKEIRFLNFGFNVIMSMFIMLVGNIISTMLKLVACSDIDGNYVHFYGGDQSCFGGVWFFGLLSIMIIIIIWIGIWLKLRTVNEIERNSKVFLFRSVTKSYKSEKWYWEFVLLSRRIILAMMVTVQYIDYNVVQYIIMSIIVIYLTAHSIYYPFNYHRANVMETLCLFLLFLACSVIIFEFHINNPKSVSVLMSMIVILPLLLLSAYGVLAVRNFFKIKNNINLLNNVRHKHRVNQWKSRFTPSIKAAHLDHKDHETETLTQKAIEMGTLDGIATKNNGNTSSDSDGIGTDAHTIDNTKIKEITYKKKNMDDSMSQSEVEDEFRSDLEESESDENNESALSKQKEKAKTQKDDKPLTAAEKSKAKKYLYDSLKGDKSHSLIQNDSLLKPAISDK